MLFCDVREHEREREEVVALEERRDAQEGEELALVGNMVVSPGGGWAADPEVVALVRPPSRLVYLMVSPAKALERLGPMRQVRPLLTRPDPLAELNRLLETRKDAYETADFVVNTELLDAKRVIEKVSELASGGLLP